MFKCNACLPHSFTGCLSRPSVPEMGGVAHAERNSESNEDYDYSDYSDDSESNFDDSEDEVNELDVVSTPTTFVSKDQRKKVERGRTAILECAVNRWAF